MRAYKKHLNTAIEDLVTEAGSSDWGTAGKRRDIKKPTYLVESRVLKTYPFVIHTWVSPIWI